MRDAARRGHPHLASLRGLTMIELGELTHALPGELEKLREVGDYL